MEYVGYYCTKRAKFFCSFVKDLEMMALLDYLICFANWERKEWKGIIIDRGELITTPEKIGLVFGWGRGKTRDIINRLKKEGIISTTSLARKGTLFKVLEIGYFGSYSNNYNQKTNQITKRESTINPTTTKQLTTKEKYPEYPEIIIPKEDNK